MSHVGKQTISGYVYIQYCSSLNDAVVYPYMSCNTGKEAL